MQISKLSWMVVFIASLCISASFAGGSLFALPNETNIPCQINYSKSVVKIYPAAEDRLALEFKNRDEHNYNTVILNGSATSGDAQISLADGMGTLHTSSNGFSENDKFIVSTDEHSHILQLKQILLESSTPKIKVQDTASGLSTQILPLTNQGTYNYTTISLYGYDYELRIFPNETSKVYLTSNGLTNRIWTYDGALIELPSEGFESQKQIKITKGRDFVNLTVHMNYSSTYDMQVYQPIVLQDENWVPFKTIGTTYDRFAETNNSCIRYNVLTDVTVIGDKIVPAPVTPPIVNFSTINSTINTFLKESSSFDIVIGRNGSVQDVLAGVDIATGLQYNLMKQICEGKNTSCEIQLNFARLDDEIADPYNTNTISIGKPQNNAITNLFMNSSFLPTRQNTAVIRRFVHNETATLIIASNDNSDTRKAAAVIARYGNYYLNDGCFDIDTTSPSNLIITDCAARPSDINTTTTPLNKFSTIESTIQAFQEKGDSFDIVIGKEGSTEDVIAAISVGMFLQYSLSDDCENAVCEIQLNSARLDDEITNPYNTNTISIGKPQNNAVTNLFMSSSLWPIKQNTAIMRRFIHNNTVTLIIAGNDNSDTRKAAKLFVNFADYNLSNICFEVNTANVSNLTINECNLSFCSESWTCTAWSVCSGTQTRACTDINACGATASKPIETQSCAVPQPAKESQNNGGSSGGTIHHDSGDAVSSGVSTPTSPKTSFDFSEIKAETPKSMQIKNKIISVSEIVIVSNKDLKSISLNVETLDEKPSTITKPEEKVYQYLSINKEAFENSDISNAKIKFSIPTQWLKDNNADENKVYLQRFESISGVKLPTKKISETADTISYEAVSPGFSYFAVTASAKETAAAPILNSPEKNESTVKSEIIVKDRIDAESKKGKEAENMITGAAVEGLPDGQRLYPLKGVLIMLITAILTLLVYTKYHNKSKNIEENI